jgi:hypothetical protein
MMADHGTVTADTADTDEPITAYTLSGTTVSTGPTVPTTGQIWPRGNP